mmetsp:Transcript_17349/g.21924  ORF Transcript_17349/g.21924 Transcript_17349/m.21924 type:complete len:395 (+) Transcript_17349:75-1259(+)|eukprot:CAMPEP_0203664122 /NCGR_PEP_ID=MMETSP0090-20130426/1589_1 /ASSEMBLY_ACC=CAM_ASM_001088 /TAXON_ID=426623 /ORGANISM="Chaetoceros affinis, Strain CCMP159" /LENGTH=394 /DNA_ID=CAMNT_0050527247 /DNA_START=137 /DNA_END=1321 /DNA_ORIENTATION=-
MPDLSTTLASIPLKSCVFNASGPRTGSGAALSKIAKSSAGAVLAKSATLKSQKGNDLPRTWHHEANPDDKDGFESHASMNSEGLPNAGIEYYLSKETIDEAVGDSDKPYMVSISGSTLADNLSMLQKIHETVQAGESRISGVELNLACPNVIGKPIIAYDFDQMDDVLSKVTALPMFSGPNALPLGVKMPPYFDGPHFDRAASVLNKYKGVVKYVASINTIGNALMIDPVAEMPVIRAKGGFAGLSGRAVKYTALSNVKKMRDLLDESIDVVGVGGVFTGEDAFEMILCGATAVQVGTCHWTEGPKCFNRICSELSEIMKSKGYNSIADFKGQSKEWSKEGVAKSREAKKKNKAQQSQGPNLNQEAPSDYQFLSMLLFALLAILVADKMGHINI